MYSAEVFGVAKSMAGRDKGKLHLIIGRDGNYAILVDGKSRKLCSPKRKKLKHIEIIRYEELAAALRDGCVKTDREVRKALEVIRTALISKGGIC